MLFELVPHSTSLLPPLHKPVVRANAKATVKNLRKLIVQHANIQGYDDTEVQHQIPNTNYTHSPTHSIFFILPLCPNPLSRDVPDAFSCSSFHVCGGVCIRCAVVGVVLR